jgi:sporulation protein YlmC with PRC-barrel domain
VARRCVRVEDLLGRVVVGTDGERAGRLQEIRTQRDGDDLVVREYLLGPFGLMERLAAAPFVRGGLRPFGVRAIGGWRVPWDKLDLSDPHHPRLTCRRDELRRAA